MSKVDSSRSTTWKKLYGHQNLPLNAKSKRQFFNFKIPLTFLETAARLINSNQNFKYIEIEQFQDFHRAENKHQKNALRRHPGTRSQTEKLK